MNPNIDSSYDRQPKKVESNSRCFVSYQNLLKPNAPMCIRQQIEFLLRNSDGTYSYQTLSAPTTWGGKRQRAMVTRGCRYKSALMLCMAEKVDVETLIGLN